MAKARTKARRAQKNKGFQAFLRANWYLAAGFVITAIFALVVLQQRQNSLPDVDLNAIPDNSLGFASQGREHIPQSEPPIQYNSNPPTSGPHYSSPARAGVYTRQLDDRQLIHNLEHGHIWISYRDAADTESINRLTELQNRFPRQIIVTHRPQNDTPIVVAAWTRLLELEEYNEDEILAFFLRYFDKAPESIPG